MRKGINNHRAPVMVNQQQSQQQSTIHNGEELRAATPGAPTDLPDLPEAGEPESGSGLSYDAAVDAAVGVVVDAAVDKGNANCGEEYG